MLPTIQRSERFQQEYKKYNEAISKVRDPQLKNELDQLLQKLVLEVQNFDKIHSEMLLSKQFSPNNTEFREKVTAIRRQLDRKLKDLSVVR